jgi:sugar transferase (PEP-CTERM/EpsH1 system associated)
LPHDAIPQVVVSRPHFLYVVHRVPYPPDKGDRIRSFHLLKQLAGYGRVHLACLADEPVAEEVQAALGRYCERVAILPLDAWWRWGRALVGWLGGRTVTEGAFSSPPLRRLLCRWIGETRYEACLASASSMIPYLRMPQLHDVPRVVDIMDVDSQKWLDYAANGSGPLAWLYRLEGRRLRQLECQLPAWARAVTVVSEAEAGLYRQFCPDGPIYAVPNGVDLEYFQPESPVAEQGLVFVGALDYRPNVEGIRWFCREVWPHLRKDRPRITLSLVGRKPNPAVRQLAQQDGIELVGQVPDVRPYLARAAVVVVPLLLARGVQNKVLEALALAKATIATPQALAGLKVQPETHVLSASTPREWVAAIRRLLADADLRRRLGSAGRRFVEEHHRWDHCLDGFRSILGLKTG